MNVIAFLIFVLMSVSAYGAPSVSGTSGTISDNNAITITGSGFGATGPTIILFDDFESGTVGQNLKTGAGSATIGQWNSLNTVPPKYSSDNSVSGTKAWKVTGVAGVEGQTNAIVLLDNTTEVFFSWWCYVPTTSPWSGEEAGNPYGPINWKIMWMTQDNWSGDNDQDWVMLDVANHWYITGNAALYSREVSDVTITKGVWHRFWWWQKDGASSNGNIKISEIAVSGGVRNGVHDIITANNITTISAGKVRRKLSVNGYTRQHNGTQPTQFFDDVYVATGSAAQARVEIGDNNVYANSKKLTILTPISWDNTSITATVRQGMFGASDNAYLFVVDSSGSVSTGYPITFGDGSPPAPSVDPLPPDIQNIYPGSDKMFFRRESKLWPLN